MGLNSFIFSQPPSTFTNLVIFLSLVFLVLVLQISKASIMIRKDQIAFIIAPVKISKKKKKNRSKHKHMWKKKKKKRKRSKYQHVWYSNIDSMIHQSSIGRTGGHAADLFALRISTELKALKPRKSYMALIGSGVMAPSPSFSRFNHFTMLEPIKLGNPFVAFTFFMFFECLLTTQIYRKEFCVNTTQSLVKQFARVWVCRAGVNLLHTVRAPVMKARTNFWRSCLR